MLDRNRDEKFDFDTESVGTFEYVFKNESVDGRISRDLLRSYGYGDPPDLSARVQPLMERPDCQLRTRSVDTHPSCPQRFLDRLCGACLGSVSIS